MLHHAATRAVSLPANARSAKGRLVIMASLIALVTASFDMRPAPAAAKQTTSASEDIAFSARKRSRSRGGDAAGLAMMGLMIGAVGGAIAAQQRRDAYEDAYNARYRAYPGYSHGGGYGAYAPRPAYHHHHHRAAPVIVPQYRHGGHHGSPDGYAGPVKRAY